MAIAVASAPTSTDVRRSEEARLRDASKASTPAMRRKRPDETAVSPLTSAGMAKAQAAIISRAAAYPKNGLPAMAGANDAAAPNSGERHGDPEIAELCTRAAYSRSPRAMASTGETSDASRAGEAAEASETPTPTASPSSTMPGVNFDRSGTAADVEILAQLRPAAAPRRSPSACRARCPAARLITPKHGGFAEERGEYIRCGSRQARARCRSPDGGAPRKPRSC